jgi:hypothetical protein
MSDVFGRDDEVMVDETIQNEMSNPQKYPPHPFLINPVLLVIIVSPAKRIIVHDGKEGENNVGQKKEIREGTPGVDRLLMVLEVININDESKHKHGPQSWPDDVRPRGMDPSDSESHQHSTRYQENDDADEKQYR